jgi:adenosylcobinamide amidohydrolase
MAKGQMKKTKEAKKPKKEKPKVLATAGMNNPVAAAGKKK